MVIKFNLLEIYFYCGNWWVSICSFDTDEDGTASLLHIEHQYCHWRFDLLWMARLVRKLREPNEW